MLQKKQVFARAAIRKKEIVAKTAKKPPRPNKGMQVKHKFLFGHFTDTLEKYGKNRKKNAAPEQEEEQGKRKFLFGHITDTLAKIRQKPQKKRRVRTRERRGSAIFIGSRQIAVRAGVKGEICARVKGEICARVKGEICAGAKGEICKGTKGEIPI